MHYMLSTYIWLIILWLAFYKTERNFRELVKYYFADFFFSKTRLKMARNSGFGPKSTFIGPKKVAEFVGTLLPPFAEIHFAEN